MWKILISPYSCFSCFQAYRGQVASFEINTQLAHLLVDSNLWPLISHWHNVPITGQVVSLTLMPARCRCWRLPDVAVLNPLLLKHQVVLLNFTGASCSSTGCRELVSLSPPASEEGDKLEKYMLLITVHNGDVSTLISMHFRPPAHYFQCSLVFDVIHLVIQLLFSCLQRINVRHVGVVYLCSVSYFASSPSSTSHSWSALLSTSDLF